MKSGTVLRAPLTSVVRGAFNNINFKIVHDGRKIISCKEQIS